MRTWSDIISCLRDDAMDKEVSNRDKFTDVYKDFVSEVIYHITQFLKEVNYTMLKTHYDGSAIDIAFENKNKLFVARIYRWATRLRVYSIDSIEDFDTFNNWYKQASRNMPQVDPLNPLAPLNPFLNFKLPKHKKFKVGDLVYLGKNAPWYKKKHDENKVLEVTNVIPYSSMIVYIVKSLSYESATYTRFAEGNLKKIEGGV